MINVLKSFTSDSIFNATSRLLEELKIQFSTETREPIHIQDFYDGPLPQYLIDAFKCVEASYYIGILDDASLSGKESDIKLRNRARYDAMFVFACEIKADASLTRTVAAALTRGFNRIASASPVVLVMRQADKLTLATCERTDSAHGGEKLGKVSVLRNVDCTNPHRGHLDILLSLGNKQHSTFDSLYAHWKEVFSNELLTKKFYGELSDWYAWAVKTVRFPNSLTTNDDDDKFNHESCIRLITRLIFVWFLKQKNLIPEEYFDEEYIKENFIDNFDPHDRENLIYNPNKSNYYRLILQNLFFATLNCPIVAEGKTTPNNRRFRTKTIYQGRNKEFNINNLMRYEDDFMEGGAAKFLKLANSKVPFLNGGLFDCLDDKRRGMYFDGFSDRKESLESLYLPDYLFFGDEVGRGIDLSQWYGDRKKRNVSARGIIDIFNRYTFTVEENTPLDQEVSLDPELLGKAFENLLASYNPETQQSARKQTGSFYTPREIVQYMVDESLIAHLKRICGEDMEPQYRHLLSYATDDVNLSEDQQRAIMNALYDCRVLDPACGSGAFPMGMLQQMVHVLRQIDPENTLWRELMEKRAVELSRDAYSQENENERTARLENIAQAFNRNVNDPDYARKLFLIEHCIFGVDIQPIATQISKLRFFISLVVDQRPTKDASDNFGIRPLPNLESNFVTANTLVPLNREKSVFLDNPDVISYESQLKELNHRLFQCKSSTKKEELVRSLIDTRRSLAQVMENEGLIGEIGYNQLLAWDMFDQNASSPFFDPEWMFGVKDGFDIVIGNPPYIKEYTHREAFIGIRGVSPYYMGKMDLWYIFACYGLDLTVKKGILCFIAQNNWTTSSGAKRMRKKITNSACILQMLDFNDFMVFGESASIQTMIMLFSNDSIIDNYTIDYRKLLSSAKKEDVTDLLHRIKTNNTYFSNPIFNRKSYKDKFILFNTNSVLDKIAKSKEHFSEDEVSQGIVFPQNFLSQKNVDTLNSTEFNVGGGIFGLNDQEYKDLNLGKEKKLIRPYYTSNEVLRYYTNPHNKLWMIYTGSSFKDPNSLNDYPIIKAHLDKFQQIITSSHKPYGLHRARRESIFKGEKVIAQRKCVGRPLFSYSNFDCFVTQTYNIISTDRWNSKFLTGLMNSKLALYWFKNRGKMQGENFQIDKEPLLNFPIAFKNIFGQIISKYVDLIISKEGKNCYSLEKEIDHIVYHLYDLTYDEVLVVDPETPITREEYESFKLEDCDK